MSNPVKELSYAERATWGRCAVCEAAHGEWCNGLVGFPLGRNINGEVPSEGVHLGRLQAAPMYVELRPVSGPATDPSVKT